MSDLRVAQIGGRSNTIRDATGTLEKFDVDPPLILDPLALVGDAADGYPGIPSIGEDGRSASKRLWDDRELPAAISWPTL